jgi:hypothetical protein
LTAAYFFFFSSIVLRNAVEVDLSGVMLVHELLDLLPEALTAVSVLFV